MRRVGTAMAAVLLATTVGCSGSRGTELPHGQATAPETQPTGAAESCPDVTGVDGSYAAIDYVDFIQAFGRQYVVSTNATNISGSFDPKPTRRDLGRVVLRSTCSFSALNDRTHKSPGEPRDGDTGFLPPGTPIHALRGWSTQCRLAAEHDGHLHVYLAYRNGAKVATPRSCALGHPM